jgi:predicted small integral membrane protein
MRIGFWITRWLAGALLLNGAAFAATVKLVEGTQVRVRLKTELLSEKVQQGMRVDLEVAEPVVVNSLTVIPEGAVAWGAIQEVKKHKFILFDVEGLRLPNMQQVKLRSIPRPTRNPDKDMIRIETKRGDDVGASRGALFNAYIDAAADVEVTPPAAPIRPPASTPVAAPVMAAPALVTVQLFSDPMGADIVIDDEYVGNTPSILKVKAEKHRLEFQFAGYSTMAQVLDLSSSTGLRTVQVTLEKVQ